MVRSNTQYVCQSCGAVASKWAGRCDGCGEWNSLVEEAVGAGPKGSLASSGAKRKSKSIELVSLSGQSEEVPRLISGVTEFDRVCGGGLVPGSAILVGGDPGIGKSTILLQACARLASKGSNVVYVSGEEAIAQVRLRASRLGLSEADVQLASETNLRDIIGSLDKAPDVLVIDSIQTMWSDALESAPGTVAQVRASTQELVRYAKKKNTVVLIVGHVTKDGQIAGPRVMEHMVDAVLYFEGERGHQFRILRAVKNRFGATDEIGVFEMTDKGLAEVTNPSELFLAGRETQASGAAVFAGIEGSRPLLVEIQALVSQSSLGTPRRAVVGWDGGRLSMVLAVLEARCGISFGGQDVYLNVAGGLRITEPAADLAVAAALVSSAFDAPLPADCVLFGEISLSGTVRPVGQRDTRLKEAEKLGFSRAILPSPPKGKGAAAHSGLTLTEMEQLHQLVDYLQPNP
ncbi:MAG: DNA repair protein RadA [Alphaproteobacteria bacterium]|nr:MAG: DNA repair protein RadA [Alphaproteobacteria bacterium]